MNEPVSPVVPAELAALLATAAQAPPEWAAALTAEARLDADLALDEHELSLLADLVQEHYGADLGALRAGLDLDALAALAVGDLVELVELVRR